MTFSQVENFLYILRLAARKANDDDNGDDDDGDDDNGDDDDDNDFDDYAYTDLNAK